MNSSLLETDLVGLIFSRARPRLELQLELVLGFHQIKGLSPYSVQMRENADQNNSEYGYFSCSGSEIKRDQNAEKSDINHLLPRRF